MAELDDLFARVGSELAAGLAPPAASELRARGQARARRRAASLSAAALVVVATGVAAVGVAGSGADSDALVPAAGAGCEPTSAADAARTPAGDPPPARGGRGVTGTAPLLAGSSSEALARSTVVVARVVSMQQPVLAGGNVGLPYVRPSAQRLPASDEPTVVRPMRFAVVRTVQGTSPDCLDLDVPGGSTGTHVTDLGSSGLPRTAKAGDQVLLLEQAGSYALAAPDVQGRVQLPFPDGSLVALSDVTVPDPREARAPDVATTGESGREDGQDLGYATEIYGNMPDGRLRLVFDRVDLLSGDAAEVAAQSAGQETSNGSFLRNTSTQTRDVPISPAVVIHGSTHLNPDGGAALQRRDLDELLQFVQADPRAEDTVFRWTVKGGEVVDLYEQHRP